MAKSKKKVTRKRATASGRRSEHEVLAGFLPAVAKWFSKTFDRPSPAQELAWPVIRRGESTLLLAPTGSGKTLAAFLCAIDDLYRRAKEGELADGIQVLYISPLKALGNDIHKNLLDPLEGIRKQARGRIPDIRIAVRTGDTTQAERAKMIRRPPHILITTPESLYLLLGSKRMAPNLETIRTVIVDEVHAMCDNKRGVHLAVSLERLVERVGGPLQRVGCSATLSPLEEIAAFLVGRDGDGNRRPCTVVDAGMRKDLDIRVMAPLPDFLEATNAALWSSAYELLLEEISGHTTTLVFCNSRYKAERTSLRLCESAGENVRVGSHHSSMSKEIRLEAEDDLKAGRLDALVATASLELGIDIGSIDLVYQLESPKSVATGLQRIGRAGHLLDETSKGRILIFERDELLEAAAICKAMLDGKLDAIHIPRGCLDVVAQQITGAVAARDWQAEELLALVRRAYPYADLTQEDFEAVLDMLAADYPFEMNRPPRSLVLWDRATGRLSSARGARSISAMCVGTIAETSEYDVIIEGSKKRIGRVQSEFVDQCLRTGDLFVLGSTCWKLMGFRRNQLLVQEAPGATPTVPWWSGPIEPRTVEVGEWIGQLREQIAERADDPDVSDWLQSEYRLCPHAAGALIDYIREQKLASGFVPSHERLLVEMWRDELGRSNVIIHCPYGERVNRAWGVAIATAAKRKLRQTWSVTATNDLLLLTLQRKSARRLTEAEARALLAIVSPQALQSLVANAAQTEGVLTSSFRDVAVCGLQVLRAWQGRRVPFWLQNYRAGELYEAAGQSVEYPVVAEVLRGYLEESLDTPYLGTLLGRIESGETELVFQEVDAPSPLTHSLIARDLYRGDRRMNREQRAHVLRLHRRVLQEVLNEEQMAQLLDPRAIERLERRQLRRSETTQARSSDELAKLIRDLGDPPATMEAISQVVDGDAASMLEPLVEDGRVVAIEVPDCEAEPVRLVAADLWREYHDAFALGRKGEKLSVLIPKIEDGEIVGFDSAPATKVIPAKWRKEQAPRDARRAVIERHLRSRGPVTLYEIVNHTGWPIGVVESILQELVAEGKAAQGVYTSDKPRPQYVNKANLEEIHRLTMGYLKREMAACAPYEVVDFVTRWQHLYPSTRLAGLDGLRKVIRQLQGFEIHTGALEPEMLTGRIVDYSPEMLERLIASGEVCWMRVGDYVKRGKLALCLRKDAEWLCRGIDRTYDVEQGADADIPEVIVAVREYFRENKIAFFDDVVEEIGHHEDSVLRAVWYLAWCGELTCDTYECVRHAGFLSTLSACYDLYSTPQKIVAGRMTAEPVINRLKQRKLDPRLGRWSATLRLAPPKKPVSDEEVIQCWAQQLLSRWGIVSPDVLDAEAAAPAWPALVPELKRLELLGKVSRGYFIESHRGEQYGLPEAIELLRDCRARRSEGKELGYLPDEPVFCVSNRDPANLYTSCLDIVQEDGSTLRRAVRSGNVQHRMAIQAGQVLLFHDGNIRQLATLTRKQLARCVEALTHDFVGDQVKIGLHNWNDYPIDGSPAAGLLWEKGFRFEKQNKMTFPPTRSRVNLVPGGSSQEIFLPHYEEPPPVEYGPEWAIRRAPREIRLTLERVLDVVTKELDGDHWKITWGSFGLKARYREHGNCGLLIRKNRVYVNVTGPLLRNESGKRVRVHRRTHVERPADVNEEFAGWFRESVGRMEEQTDEFLARQDGFAEGRRAATAEQRAGRTRAEGSAELLINRAPVLTLWGAVVAERMGYDHDAALTLGRCLAGLSAQAKGRRLRIFEEPAAPDDAPPTKAALGEDLWIDLCGRALPAKNTRDGVRAVVEDKPINPRTVQRYLEGKFEDRLGAARDAMTHLARSFAPDTLREAARELYERFRPDIPDGVTGWGAKGKLDLAFIRSLAQKP